MWAFEIAEVLVYDPNKKSSKRKPIEQDLQQAKILAYYPQSNPIEEKCNTVGMAEGVFQFISSFDTEDTPVESASLLPKGRPEEETPKAARREDATQGRVKSQLKAKETSHAQSLDTQSAHDGGLLPPGQVEPTQGEAVVTKPAAPSIEQRIFEEMDTLVQEQESTALAKKHRQSEQYGVVLPGLAEPNSNIGSECSLGPPKQAVALLGQNISQADPQSSSQEVANAPISIHPDQPASLKEGTGLGLGQPQHSVQSAPDAGRPTPDSSGSRTQVFGLAVPVDPQASAQGQQSFGAHSSSPPHSQLAPLPQHDSHPPQHDPHPSHQDQESRPQCSPPHSPNHSAFPANIQIIELDTSTTIQMEVEESTWLFLHCRHQPIPNRQTYFTRAIAQQILSHFYFTFVFFHGYLQDLIRKQHASVAHHPVSENKSIPLQEPPTSSVHMAAAQLPSSPPSALSKLSTPPLTSPPLTSPPLTSQPLTSPPLTSPPLASPPFSPLHIPPQQGKLQPMKIPRALPDPQASTALDSPSAETKPTAFQPQPPLTANAGQQTPETPALKTNLQELLSYFTPAYCQLMKTTHSLDISSYLFPNLRQVPIDANVTLKFHYFKAVLEYEDPSIRELVIFSKGMLAFSSLDSHLTEFLFQLYAGFGSPFRCGNKLDRLQASHADPPTKKQPPTHPLPPRPPPPSLQSPLFELEPLGKLFNSLELGLNPHSIPTNPVPHLPVYLPQLQHLLKHSQFYANQEDTSSKDYPSRYRPASHAAAPSKRQPFTSSSTVK